MLDGNSGPQGPIIVRTDEPIKIEAVIEDNGIFNAYIGELVVATRLVLDEADEELIEGVLSVPTYLEASVQEDGRGNVTALLSAIVPGASGGPDAGFALPLGIIYIPAAARCFRDNLKLEADEILDEMSSPDLDDDGMGDSIEDLLSQL